MRIVYLHQYFNTPEMPGSTRSYEVGRRLAAAGHQIEMITSWQKPTEHKDWFVQEIAGMRVHWLPVPYSNHMGYAARLRAFFRFAAAAARRAVTLPADVVFASSTPLTIALPAAYAAWRKRIPMVFEVRDLWPDLPIAMGALKDPLSRWSARRLERFAYARAARVVALSSGMADGVARTGYRREHISVVPNGSDLELFARDGGKGAAFRRQHGIPEDAVVVGYVGTLGRINDAGYLVRAAHAMNKHRGLYFLMVGDGQERAKIEAEARELGVAGHNLLMLPSMAKERIPEVLSAVDIATSLALPLPELEANSANKFFDALAAGCCVAVNYGGWQPQLLVETDAGLRLDQDPRVGAGQLEALAGDRERLREMGRKARQLAEQRFSREVLARQVEGVLVQAVAEAAHVED